MNQDRQTQREPSFGCYISVGIKYNQRYFACVRKKVGNSKCIFHLGARQKIRTKCVCVCVCKPLLIQEVTLPRDHKKREKEKKKKKNSAIYNIRGKSK